MKILIPILIVCLITAPAIAGDLTLQWDSDDPDSVGFKMHYGTSIDVLDQEIDVGNVLEYTVTGLIVGTLYYFKVSAYDAAGNSSDRSYAVCDKAILGTPKKVTMK